MIWPSTSFPGPGSACQDEGGRARAGRRDSPQHQHRAALALAHIRMLNKSNTTHDQTQPFRRAGSQTLLPWSNNGHPSGPTLRKEPSSERLFLEIQPRIHIQGLDTLPISSCGKLQKTFRYELPADASKDLQLSPEPTSGCTKPTDHPALYLCGLYLGSYSAAPCIEESHTDRSHPNATALSALQRPFFIPGQPAPLAWPESCPVGKDLGMLVYRWLNMSSLRPGGQGQWHPGLHQ